MSYETAPATQMLATHCLVCRKPLVDAASVEAGMGPDCRKKHGYNVNVDPEDRADANRIVHKLAAQGDALEPQALQDGVTSLQLLGFEMLASVIVKRRVPVRIELNGGEYSVIAPYNAEFVHALKTAVQRAGHRASWVASEKAWHVPAEAKPALLWALRTHYLGSLGMGPKGAFRIESGSRSVKQAQNAVSGD